MARLPVMIFTGLLLLGAAARADDLSPICPDRPGRGTSACTMDAGHAQLELGLYDETFQRRSGVTTNFTIAASPLLKYGVSDSLDLEAGVALYQGLRLHDGGGTLLTSGIGDVFLRAKWNPLGGNFALALEPYVKVPTATGGLGNGAVEGGLVLPMSYDLGGNWSLGATPEVDILVNASGSGSHLNLVNVVGLGSSFGSITLGAEVWTGQNLDPLGTVSQYSFDLDAAWLADNDTQVDGGINLGLNRATPDMELYAGVSERF